MINIKTPHQTDQIIEDQAQAKHQLGTEVSLLDQGDQFESQLAGRIRKAWQSARNDKTRIEQTMIECLRDRKGEYSPDEMAQIKSSGGSDIFIKLATSKIRTGIAHIKSILIPDGERAHGIEPTANPSLPEYINEAILQRIISNPNMVDDQGQAIDPMNQLDMLQTMARREIKSMAKQRARNMDRKIMDQLQEGGWNQAMLQYIEDFTTYPAAFMKGPYFAMQPRLTYQHTAQGMMPISTVEPVVKFRTINPFDAYPAAGVGDVNEGDFIERIKIKRSELYGMIGSHGYNDQAIREILLDFRQGKMKDWLWTDSVRSHIAEHVNHWQANDNLCEGLHWYGEAQGYELIEQGVSPSLIDDPLRTYECDAILIGRHIIRAAINTDPLYRRQIHSSCYEKIEGSVFGNSPSMLMKSTQRMVNATARALQNNLAHASGFQVDVDYTRVSSETDVFDIHPFKIWQTRESEFAGDRQAVRFFQPESNAPELINVIDYFKAMADSDTGIPEFLSGGAGGNTGADATAKGRGMLLDQSAKLLLSSIMNIDRDVCIPKIEMLYDYNMLNDEDEDIKGDAQVVAKGINARLQLDAARNSHMALLEVTGNDPEDRALIGLEGRAKLLKSMLKTFDNIDHDEIIPSDEELEQRVKQLKQDRQQQPPDPAIVKVQAEQQQAAQRMELDHMRMEHEQRMDTLRLNQDREIADNAEQTKRFTAESITDRRVQDEIIKLRATRMSERERLQIDVLREKLKAETQVKLQVDALQSKRDVEKIRMDGKLAQQKNAASLAAPAPAPEQPSISADDVRNIVESVMGQMVGTFQNDTIKVMDEIKASMLSQLQLQQTPQSQQPPSTINVQVDATREPVRKTIKTTRDGDGNLSATVEES